MNMLAATGLPTIIAVVALVAVAAGLGLRRWGGLGRKDDFDA